MNRGKPNIIFRCDGSSEIGLGHVVRCLALADELHRHNACPVTFAMRRDALGVQLCEERGYRVVRGLTPYLPDDGVWLRDLSHDIHADILVLDVRDELPREVVQRLRDEGLLIVTIDDPSPRRLDADLAFYPPIPQVRQLDWFGFTGKQYVGWEWVVTRPEFSPHHFPKTSNPRPIVLVTMGGSDPAGMTAKVVEGFNDVRQDCELLIVTGPGFQGHEALNVQLARSLHPYTVQHQVKKMWEVMSRADLCVASFGTTAYELAAMGVPSIFLGLTPDHVRSASTFVKEGIATCLGYHEDVNAQMVGAEVSRLLGDANRLERMRGRAIDLMKHSGAPRIATTILQEWEQHHDVCQGMATAQG